MAGADATRRRLDTVWAPLEATPGAIVVIHGDGSIRFANEEAARTFGYDRNELLGAAATMLVTPRCGPLLHERLTRLGGAPTGHGLNAEPELVGLRKDGQEFPVELSLGRTMIEDAAAAIAVFRDRSTRPPAERRHAAAADEAVGRTRSWLEALLEFAPAIIIAVNPGGTIEYINRVLPQYTREQVMGSHWLQYFPSDLRVQMKSALDTVLTTGAAQAFEAVTMAHDGTPIWYLSQLGPIREDGRIIGGIVVAQDITERKRAETELFTARRLAVLGTLAAGVAHEINTPIQFVGDSLRFLRESALDLLGLIDRFQALRRGLLEGRALEEVVAEATEAEEQADLDYVRAQMPAAFDRCVDGLNRVTVIVRSLKEFAHPADREMAAVDLNHAIESTLTIATNEYKYVADLETDFGDLPRVMCHVGEISQVVLNIVVNAAHAIAETVQGTERKGLIRVRTRCEGDDAVITISDTGPGIAEHVRPRIFDPFFTTKDVGKGTGQGLAIAWSTVKEKHGGDLTFETELGHGTTFCIRLPVSGNAKTEPDAKPS